MRAELLNADGAATTIGRAVAAAARDLVGRTDSPRLDAELLLCQVLGCDRGGLIADGAQPLPAAAGAAFAQLVARRAAGEPVAYITGRKGFWSLDFEVTPDVLIPRPETEVLVEWALEILGAQFGSDSPVRRVPAIADLGTGSGAIALALAHERPRALVVATDASAAALAVARGNAQRLKLRNVDFEHGEWFAALAASPGAGGGRRSFDLIACNPPYVAQGDPHLDALRFEPGAALTSGTDGLAALREIIAGAQPYLSDDGWLLVEHGATQGEAVRGLFAAAGFAAVATRRDLGDRERATGGRRP